MRMWVICTILGVFVLNLLLNKNLGVYKLVKSQFVIYKEAGKYRLIDFFTFFITPLGMSILLHYEWSKCFVSIYAEDILVLSSIIAAVLLAFFTILGKKNNEPSYSRNTVSNKRKDVEEKVFIAITLSLLYLVIIIVLVFISKLVGHYTWVIHAIDYIVYYLMVKSMLMVILIFRNINIMYGLI